MKQTLMTTEELKHLASSDNTNELTRRLARECLANREAQPVGFRYRHKDTVSWLYNDWRWPDSVEAEQCQIEWLYTAPPAPAVPDEIDSFADQVIGTKDKIIRLPAPMPVPHEGIRVYLNADAIISYLEKQGYIVEVSRE